MILRHSLQHYFRQFTHKIAIAMIAVVLLQFAGGNMGEHQLHLGSHDEEPANHPHLQFTAEVVTVDIQQCSACSDSSQVEQDANCDGIYGDGQLVSNDYALSNLLASNVLVSSFDTSSAEPHSHQVSKTETKLFDLCLDCQCHGGHATVMSSLSTEPSVPMSDELTLMVSTYLPPESVADYRPPIV